MLLPGPHDTAAAVAFSCALNQIPVVFHDSSSVLSALKSFHEALVEPSVSVDLRNKRLLELFKALVKNLRINIEELGEGFLMQAFSVGTPTLSGLDFHFQGVQWMKDQLVVVGSLPCGGTGQRIPMFIPSDLAHTLGCTLIELSRLAEERANELRRTGQLFDVASMASQFAERVNRRQRINKESTA